VEEEETKTKRNFPVFWVITRREVVWNRRFRTSYPSHIQRSSYPRIRLHASRWDPTGSTATSVSNHLTPRNNPKSEEFTSTAAEAYDLAKVEKTFVLTSEINSKQRTITLIEFVDYKTDMKAGNTGRTSSYTRR
jgi:hypothetical protein